MNLWLARDYWMERIPFYKAVLWILTSTLVMSGSALFGLMYYKHIQELRTNDYRYAVSAVVQNCCAGVQLPTLYLTEIVNLSADRPYHLYNWNIKEAEKKLKNSPYIKDATIERIPPDTVKISYYSRTPVAVVGDLSNALIDTDGHLLPRHPLIREPVLPEMILGQDKVGWGEKLAAPETTLALQLKDLIDHEFPQMKLKSIDVSRAYARSAGKRQIVVTFEVGENTHILRVTINNYRQQLANYRELIASNQLAGFKSIVIDLRLDHLAYLQDIIIQGEPHD